MRKCPGRIYEGQSFEDLNGLSLGALQRAAALAAAAASAALTTAKPAAHSEVSNKLHTT
jgi:hypothetical protein